MDERSQPPADASPPQPSVSPAALRAPGLGGALRDPVVVILVLAGIFDGLAGNVIHAILLIAVGLALGREVALGRGGAPDLSAARGRPSSATTPWPPWSLVLVTLVYALVVGGFARYSWPATVAVVFPATIALLVTWREPRSARRDVPVLDRLGAGTWAATFVGVALWELAALLLQPSLTTDSAIHPTISVLTDPLLATHPGRTVALLLWLGLGWFILQR